MGCKQAGDIKQVDCCQEQREGRLMYKSAVEALEAVVGPQCAGSGCRISRVPSEVSLMENGIEYCFVEVTCSTGGQYGIEAFGEEARELHATASSMKEKQVSPKVMPLLVAGIVR
jgi:hypothetical protein